MIRLISLFKDIILEGGNVFGTTDRIKKEDIPPTLDKFTEELGKIFPKKKNTFKFQTLGSVGQKAESGDIDLGYDGNNLVKDGKPDLEGWNIDPQEYQQTFDRIRKRVKTASEEQSTKRAMLELIAKQVAEAPGPIRVDIKQAGGGSLFFEFPQYDAAGNELDKNVQIDINVGDLNWLKFSYFSTAYEGNVKGLHRTQLLVAMFANAGYTFSHANGVKNKETGEVEATSPEGAIKVLNDVYGLNLTKDTVANYFDIIKTLRANVSEDDLNDIFDTYLKILDKTRADIPQDLQQYWIDNQQRLGLTGKFLPDDSNLAQYKTA